MQAKDGRICPYLGITRDPATHMGYSSDENLCFKERKPHSPNYAIQIRTCLSPTYINCMTYQGFQPHPVPLTILEKQPVVHSKKLIRKPVAELVLGLLVVLGTLSGILFFTSRIPFSQQPPKESAGGGRIRTALPNAAMPNSVSFSETASQTIFGTNTSNFAEVIVSSPSILETGTTLPDLYRYEVTRIPGGSDQSFLVHVVLYGETLDMIAVKYNTTIEAIMAVNYKLKPPIWAGSPLVIPIGAQGTIGLPSFDVYVVESHDNITAESLAAVLGVEEMKLEYYNNCSKDCKFSNGDVLLIPHNP